MKSAICIALLGIALLIQANPAEDPTATGSSKAKTTAKKPGARSASVRKRKSVRRAAGPSYQTHPDPERYQQIQQALADRGYFKGQVNGQWGDDSTDAMRRFQADQKIDNDGKIDSLSLNALGLGPRHDAGVPNVPGTGSTQTAPAQPPNSEIAPPSQKVPPQ